MNTIGLVSEPLLSLRLSISVVKARVVAELSRLKSFIVQLEEKTTAPLLRRRMLSRKHSSKAAAAAGCQPAATSRNDDHNKSFIFFFKQKKGSFYSITASVHAGEGGVSSRHHPERAQKNLRETSAGKLDIMSYA